MWASIFIVIVSLIIGGYTWLMWNREHTYAILADGELVKARPTDKLPMSFHSAQEAQFAMDSLIVRAILPIDAEVVQTYGLLPQRSEDQ